MIIIVSQHGVWPAQEVIVARQYTGDFILLFQRDAMKPFEFGVGVFPDHKCNGPAPCLGFTGWVTWEYHTTPGQLVREWDGGTADFIFQPVPEPHSIVSFLVFMLLRGGSRSITGCIRRRDSWDGGNPPNRK